MFIDIFYWVDETGVLFKYLNKISPFFIPDLHAVLIFLKTLFKVNLNLALSFFKNIMKRDARP